MSSFKDQLTGPAGQAALDAFFEARRSGSDRRGIAGRSPDVTQFLAAHDIAVPEDATISVVYTESAAGVVPMRPLPDCPGGWCVPERCPDGVWQCGWICYCP